MKFLADENFNGHVLHALVERFPGETIVRVQDVGLSGADDPVVLDWAAQHDRILLTHDMKTMPNFAYDRVAASLPMPGVFEINDDAPITLIVDDMVLVIECGRPDEWRDIVWYLPF